MGLKSAFAALFRAGDAGDPGQDRGPADDFWYGESGQRTGAGVRVTPDVALKAAAVYACVKVLAETISTLSIGMKEITAAGSVDAPNHPLHELIRFQPNNTQTSVEFWEQMILHAAIRGTAYAEIVPGPRGAVDQLLPRIETQRPERLRDGSYRFHLADPFTGENRVLLQEEVFRIPGMSSDGVTGIRAVDLAAEDIGLGMAADQYASRVFSNKLNIGGFLIHPGKLGPEAQRNLIQALVERFAGIRNLHRPIVLQEGMKWERASMDAKDAQLLEARKWQITLIAMRWRIPLNMLGIYDGATHSNVEQQSLDLVNYTLRPWVTRIEQAIRRDLILAKPTYFADFNMDALKRGDSIARADYLSAALGSGGHQPWMTLNEARRSEGLPDVAGGDVIGQPSASIRADPKSKAAKAKVARRAALAALQAPAAATEQGAAG